MSWPMVKLLEVAPAKPLRKVGCIDDNHVLQITLDHIESDSGCLLKRNYAPVSEAGSSTHWFDDRYVLYSKLRPYLNKVYLPDEVGIGTTELVPMLPNEEVLDRKYLAYFLRSKVFVDWVSSQTAGAKMPRVSMKVFWDYEIPLPPLTEQKRIAAILDKADAIRRKRQQAIQLADEFLSAEFLRKFGDPKDSPYGSRSLNDVTLKITDGAHFTPTYVDSGIPFLRVTDINRDTIDWSQVKYIPNDEHQELIKRCKPEKGDVLYSKNGTIGVPKLIDWDQEFSIFVSLCLIKPDPRYLRGRYLYSFLQTPFALKQATQRAKAATVTNLHLVEIKEIKLPVPSLAIQDEWIHFVSKFNCLKGRLGKSLKTSNDAFNSLSQKAFSGYL